jgi:hypothetical protein
MSEHQTMGAPASDSGGNNREAMLLLRFVQ